MNLEFGRFQVLPHHREFLAEGVPVPLGSRAFDVLMVLIEAGGELVTKDEILSRVWPGMVVEEHSLQFHISALRKVLGEDRGFIKTISGRGYRFVAPVTATQFVHAAAPPSQQFAPQGVSRPEQRILMGRDAELAQKQNGRCGEVLTMAAVGLEKKPAERSVSAAVRRGLILPHPVSEVALKELINFQHGLPSISGGQPRLSDHSIQRGGFSRVHRQVLPLGRIIHGLARTESRIEHDHAGALSEHSASAIFG